MNIHIKLRNPQDFLLMLDLVFHNYNWFLRNVFGNTNPCASIIKHLVKVEIYKLFLFGDIFDL